MGIMAELKRRNVLRMAGLYIVGAWLVVQVAGTLLPVFDAPDWVMKALVLLLAIGFVPALMVAWVFELTPDGLKRDENVKPQESIAPKVAQRMNRSIIVLLLLALGYFVVDKFVLVPQREAAMSAQAGMPVDTKASVNKVTPSDMAGQLAASNQKSIAVLPFDNLSADENNAYFADGIQDEILTSLAKIGQLKVISRTSTKSYSSRPDNLPQIAWELGVANILEGSVQKAGNRVRVNVQLIEAASDSHLWAETYDRSLDDVFAVQSEVAQKIAQSLRATLTEDERATLNTIPTDNPAAYNALLRALALAWQSNSLDNYRNVVMTFERAVNLDPEFGQAWAYLAGTASYLYLNGVDPTYFTADYIKNALDQALRLQPQSIETQVALGAYRYRVLRDLPGAAQAFQKVLAKTPNNIDALASLGYVERRQGNWQQAVEHLSHASELDPRSPGLMVTIGGEALGVMRHYDEARVWLDRALALNPDATDALSYKADTYRLQGRLDDAERVLDSRPVNGEDPQIALSRSNIYLLQRRYDAVIEELQTLLAQPDINLYGRGGLLALNLGFAQRYAGQDKPARNTFQRLVTQIEPNADKMDDTLQPIALALAYAGLGKDTKALQQAQRAAALYSGDAIFRPVAEIALSQVQTMSGDHQAAIAGLARSLQVAGGITQAQLQLDPVWDPLRGDPEFEALLVLDDAMRDLP